MTQPFTSDDRLSSADFTSRQGQFVEDSVGRISNIPDSAQPAIVHPNFDPNQMPIDPARSLMDIPEPARRVNSQLRRLYGKPPRFFQPNEASLSKWRLISSEALAEHLALLNAAKLMTLPDSFYYNYSEQPLLSSLEHMTLLDMADIQRAVSHYPHLNRYGFTASEGTVNAKISKPQKTANSYDPDELLSSLYADDWQVILQPQQFESGAGSLVTDIMACSVAVHALQQCATRKSINQRYSAAQICEYVRSYLLSQLSLSPLQRNQYRQIRLFTGHIIVAAYHLGWDIQVHADGQCYVNLSSRCGLLTRYANMQDYHINGWSS